MGKSEPGPAPRARPRFSTQDRSAPASLHMGPERKLLHLLLHFRAYVELAAERLGPEEFTDPAFRAVFEALVADHELTHAPPGMEAEAARRLEELLALDEPLQEASVVFKDTVGRLKEVPLDRRAEELRRGLAQESDPHRQQELARELEELSRLRREMKADWRLAIRPRTDPLEPLAE